MPSTLKKHWAEQPVLYSLGPMSEQGQVCTTRALVRDHGLSLCHDVSLVQLGDSG